MKEAVCLSLAITLFSLPVTADPSHAAALESADSACGDVVSTDAVLEMMDRAPSHEMGKAAFRWSRLGQANRIARAIAAKACSREQAADLVVYDLFESNNRLDAVGDGGHSHGPWQLSDKRVKPEVARDPDQAAPIWLSLAAQSRKDCAALPEDEQLSELASGSCDRAHVLTRRRAALRRRVLGE